MQSIKGLLAIASIIATPLFNTVLAGTITVDSAKLFNPTGIDASAGERFSITASGAVNLAIFDGPYITDPNGVITTAPAPGTGAYNFFTSFTSPIGTPPVVGGVKTGNTPFLTGAAFGELIAGFSTTATPSSFSDFPQGFGVVGSSGSVVAPPGGGFLFLAVNDINNTSDNRGSFTAAVNTVLPENASSLVLSFFGLAALCCFGVSTRSSRPFKG
jgi:hypothetical protein